MESCWWIVRGDEDAKDARIGLGLLAKSFLGRRTKAQLCHLGSSKLSSGQENDHAHGCGLVAA